MLCPQIDCGVFFEDLEENIFHALENIVAAAEMMAAGWHDKSKNVREKNKSKCTTCNNYTITTKTREVNWKEKKLRLFILDILSMLIIM